MCFSNKTNGHFLLLVNHDLMLVELQFEVAIQANSTNDQQHDAGQIQSDYREISLTDCNFPFRAQSMLLWRGLLTECMPFVLPDGLGYIDGQISGKGGGGVVVLHWGAALNQPCKHREKTPLRQSKIRNNINDNRTYKTCFIRSIFKFTIGIHLVSL